MSDNIEPTERLFWIDIKYATFGIVSKNGFIIDAPPIARWMVFKHLEQIKPWLRSKQAKVLEVGGGIHNKI